MVAPARDPQTGKSYPANDPERAAVLGTLVVEGLARGSEDRLTVIAFGANATAAPLIVSTADTIRTLPYVNGTFFKRPLEEARVRLSSSLLPRRLFLFFTDGAPEDLKDPSEGPQLLGLSSNAAVDTVIIGLYGSADAQRIGESYLRPLARNPDDLVFVSRPQEVVAAFTRGYARALGSRPETGTLAPGGEKRIEVGKYVVEVLVAAASSAPGAAFAAKLVGPEGEIAPRAAGDNACAPGMRFTNAPGVCQPPYRHYQVFRAPNVPEKQSRWTLSLPRAPGTIDYGIVLRYDLAAAVSVKSPVRVGDSTPIAARLLFRGETFNDEAFFSSDGFAAEAVVAGKTLPLRHAGKGEFVGELRPESPTLDAPAFVEVRFRNAWMEKTARQAVVVEGFLDLALVPNPAQIDFGTWQGDRKETRRCAVIDLSGSTNADRVPVTCVPSGELTDAGLTCAPVPGSEARLASGLGQPLRYEVCAAARACCGKVNPAGLAVKLTGAHEHYASGAVSVPVSFRVQETGFLRCYWLVLALAAATLFALFVIVGFVRPHSFDAAASVHVAGSEVGLKRSSAQVLRELPGGRRGFYRNARLCLNASGDFVRAPRLAVLTVEAGASGTTRIRRAAGLERKVPRTGKWEGLPPAEMEQWTVPNVIYRSGNLYVRFS